MHEHTAHPDQRRARAPAARRVTSLAVHAVQAGDRRRHVATRHPRVAQPRVRIAS